MPNFRAIKFLSLINGYNNLHPRTSCRLFGLIGALTKMQRNALNIKTVTKQVWFYFIRGTTCTRPGYAGTITNLQIVLILNTPQNPCLLIKLPKKYLPKFSYPKKSRNRKFQTKKILRPLYPPCHLKSGVPSPPPGGDGGVYKFSWAAHYCLRAKNRLLCNCCLFP